MANMKLTLELRPAMAGFASNAMVTRKYPRKQQQRLYACTAVQSR
jgi:hypothetical protein